MYGVKNEREMMDKLLYEIGKIDIQSVLLPFS
jgi:hypothetical protein